MSLEQSYEKLFSALREIIEANPEQAPQVLALILSGGPFRPVLDKPVLLNKVALLAKQMVADRNRAEAVEAARGPR